MLGYLKQAQGMVEYAFILVLVAIVVFAALAALGPSVSNLYMSVVNSL